MNGIGCQFRFECVFNLFVFAEFVSVPLCGATQFVSRHSLEMFVQLEENRPLGIGICECHAEICFFSVSERLE